MEGGRWPYPRRDVSACSLLSLPPWPPPPPPPPDSCAPPGLLVGCRLAALRAPVPVPTTEATASARWRLSRHMKR